jgi:hypothetical protein
MTDSLLKHPLIQWLISRVESENARGWAEYLYYEVAEGLRDRPWPFFAPTSEEEQQKLRQIRDELQVWPRYCCSECRWELFPIKVWRVHTETENSITVRNKMDFDG